MQIFHISRNMFQAICFIDMRRAYRITDQDTQAGTSVTSDSTFENR